MGSDVSTILATAVPVRFFRELNLGEASADVQPDTAPEEQVPGGLEASDGHLPVHEQSRPGAQPTEANADFS